MPKVSAEYVNNKKASILAAALNVCKKKPLYEVTMKDIIKESSISQGGIYLYFSDIDDILIALINKISSNESYKQNIDTIIESKASYKEIVKSLFDFLGQYIKEGVTTRGKIQFELTVLLANHPDRQEKVMSQITDIENSQYLMTRLLEKINEGVEAGEFKPALPINDLFKFIGASLDGIERDAILQKCYGHINNTQVEVDEISLVNTLSKAVLLILNINE